MANARGTVWIALLRGINVGGKRKVPMADLRGLAEGLGHTEVATYIQSGNLVFRAAGTAEGHAADLESAIADTFGFEVPVCVRRRADLVRIRAACPFEDAAEERPKLVHVGFARGKLPRGAASAIGEYAKAGEVVAAQGQALWIDFENGVARSKITPAVLDRLVGSSVTMRNVRTLDALIELAKS